MRRANGLLTVCSSLKKLHIRRVAQYECDACCMCVTRNFDYLFDEANIKTNKQKNNVVSFKLRVKCTGFAKEISDFRRYARCLLFVSETQDNIVLNLLSNYFTLHDSVGLGISNIPYDQNAYMQAVSLEWRARILHNLHASNLHNAMNVSSICIF